MRTRGRRANVLSRTSYLVGLLMMASACGEGWPSPSPPPAPRPPAVTYMLSGFVTEMTPSGSRPIDGVQVSVRGGSGTLQTSTDSAGFYSLAGVAAGLISVSVAKDGYEPVSAFATLTADGRVDLQVVRNVFTVSGFVFELSPAGRLPLEGAWVYIESWHGYGQTHRHGLFRVGGLKAGGPGEIRVEKDGYQTEARPITIAGDQELEFQLGRRQ